MIKSKLSLLVVLLFSLPGLVQAQTNFTTTGSLTFARQLQTATLLPNGLVLVSGGMDSAVNSLSSAELYNPATGIWTTTGSLNTPRDSHSSTLLPNGLVVVAGGENYTRGLYYNDLASAELYNPATGTWTTTGHLANFRHSHTATLLPNGLVLVAGGESDGALNSAELYNATTGTWTTTGSLAIARCYHTATLLPNGLVLVAGGLGLNGSASTSPLASAELYNPATGTWTTTGSLNNSRAYHTATLLPNGLVLVTGGKGGSGTIASAELYNSATGTWATTGSMANARQFQTGTPLPNGLTLVMGGHSASNLFASAELYNPATGTWTTTGSLNNSRAEHTATLLPNGLVLAAGGIGGESGNVSIASAELYSLGLGTNLGIGTLAIPPILKPGTVNGMLTLNFTNIFGMPFLVLATTNLTLPVSSWTVAGTAIELTPGQYHFTDPQVTTGSQRLYQVRSP